MLQRINKFIAENSETSRRKADEFIEQGKVKVNGKTIQQMGTKIDPEKDIVEVNGKKIASNKHENLYIALHKPAGYITTRSDEFNRQTVMDLIPKERNLKAVGRLDKDTEGLLLFSNDGDFINKYTHPKFNCDKEYLAIIKGQLNNSEVRKLESGIMLEGKKTAPA